MTIGQHNTKGEAMNDYYSNLNERRRQEMAALENASNDEARANIQLRLDRVNALRAEYQSKYGLTMAFECLK